MTLIGIQTTAWRMRMLALAAAAGLTACGTSGVRLPDASGSVPHHPVSAPRHQVVRVAARQIGKPYRYGGSDRAGFDCSGLVQYAHRKVGIDVPRTTDSQWAQSSSPGRGYLLPGDLLFFAIDKDKTKGRHVAIYEGDGVFIHAPSSGKRVSRASLDNPYWQERMIGARTFL